MTDKKLPHTFDLILGIDATNLREGGGVTHLIELLAAAEPQKSNIARVIVWAGIRTLDQLPNQSWLCKENAPALERGLISRTLWQLFRLPFLLRQRKCDLLFVPGGSLTGHFRPVVTMSRNLLPFDTREIERYGWSLFGLKLRLLRFSQSLAFRRGDGVIFLTEFSRRAIRNVVGKLRGRDVIIPHGLNRRFIQEPREQRDISHYNEVVPYTIIYVSSIDLYKHQWHLLKAVSDLREEGFPLTVDLVGPCTRRGLTRLDEALSCLDPKREWARYAGKVPYGKLHDLYAKADLGLFASSCENMPNILLETMASGLPVACSSRGPMPEVLSEAGVYFDPERPDDIASAIRTYLVSPELRAAKAEASFKRAQRYSWERCAEATFGFLAEIGTAYQYMQGGIAAGDRVVSKVDSRFD